MTEENLWGSLDLANWANTPCLFNRVANEEDVANGVAVFYIQSHETEHFSIDIPIPSLAYQIDDETNEKVLVIVIQAEKVDGEDVIGVRYLDGGNGVCSLRELEFGDLSM